MSSSVLAFRLESVLVPDWRDVPGERNASHRD